MQCSSETRKWPAVPVGLATGYSLREMQSESDHTWSLVASDPARGGPKLVKHILLEEVGGT